MRKCKKINLINKNFSIVDWIILGILISICFVSYQHPDIKHTAGSSFTYLNGHILDFYEYNKPIFGVNNYLPTTYILFAIWNIPLKLFGIVDKPTMDVVAFARMWYKLGTAILFFATAYFIYKICRFKQVSTKNSVWAAFLFVSNPIAVYSEFIFGQYDIITTFFMVLGIYYYFQKKNVGFILSFAVALTCKYFALLIFVPLLLLREKNVWKIIRSICGVASLFVVETLVYIISEAFREGIFGFKAAGFIFNVGYDNGYTVTSIVVVSWVLLCAYAYFKECKDDMEEFQWCLYLSGLVMFICFGLSFWHPQWLLMAVPFWTLGLFFHKKSDIYILLDLLMMICFSIFVCAFYQNMCDQIVMTGGVFATFIVDYLVAPKCTMANLYHITDANLMFSSLVALMLVYSVFMHPSKLCSPDEITVGEHKGLLRLRYIGGILFFVVPSFICLYINMH